MGVCLPSKRGLPYRITPSEYRSKAIAEVRLKGEILAREEAKSKESAKKKASKSALLKLKSILEVVYIYIFDNNLISCFRTPKRTK